MNRPAAVAPPLGALTGATGFLGSHLADQLLGKGWRVRASVRPTSDRRWLRGKPIETLVLPLAPADTDADPALDRFLACADAVVHCAGVVRAAREDGYRHGNVETTRRLLVAAARQGSCRTFLLVSSLAAAGPAPAAEPRHEDGPCQPISPYGRSKLAAEQLLAGFASRFRTVILRPPALYGPRDRAFLPLFRLAQAGWTVRLGRTLRELSLVDGRDAAAAAVALLETEAATGPFFVDDGRCHTWPDLAAAFAAVCRRRIRTLTVPLGLLRAGAGLLGPRLASRTSLLHPGRLADLAVPGWVCSGERLRRETGFRAGRDLRRGFAETLDFYHRNGWLT